MKRRKSIQIKATILLIVFSLNTILGFACSIGLNILLTASNYHQEEIAKPVIHVHADGMKHIHQPEHKAKAVVHVHADGKKHIHQEKVAKPKENKSNNLYDLATPNTSQADKNKCCTTKVTQFEQLDKYVPQSVKFNPVFFATTAADFYNIDSLYTSYINTDIKYFVRSYHPPIPNIRIAIQSFQV